MMGLQFENLVLVNFAALVPLLNLQGKLVVSAAPFRCVRSSRGGGVPVDKVETPYGKEIPPSDRSPLVQKIVEMYSDWPYKVRARLFVYPEGHFGASVDD